jgi:demethoxyubiquinone hydroxylase (CLK1/Coq7/Cat5 family)
MGKEIDKETYRCLQDLHAREMMRLGWYRQRGDAPSYRRLRERKARHQAFLLDLLRRRGVAPGKYARLFYYAGHMMGLAAALVPQSWAKRWETTLEYWLLIRYEKYLEALKRWGNLRSMIEALSMKKLSHDEPGGDVILLLEQFADHQRVLSQPQ